MELSVDERERDEELTALARKAGRGNADAFNALARRVRDRVRQWAQGVTHDSDEADDVAQLVLLRLHASIDRFEGRSLFTTWLYRVTRNVAFNRVHRERHRGTLLERRAPEIVEGAAERGTTAGHDGAELEELVKYYFAQLPERQREVFELGDLRGLNSSEIAGRLGITPSTARGLLMKARRRIRLRILQSHAHLLEDYSP